MQFGIRRGRGIKWEKQHEKEVNNNGLILYNNNNNALKGRRWVVEEKGVKEGGRVKDKEG